MRGRALGVTELEGESEGPASMRPMTLRLVTAVGVDCDMPAIFEALRAGLWMRMRCQSVVGRV